MWLDVMVGLWNVVRCNGRVVGCGWMQWWGCGMWLDVMVGLWDVAGCNGGVVDVAGCNGGVVECG